MISRAEPPSLQTLMSIARSRDLELEADVAPHKATERREVPWAAVLADVLGKEGLTQLAGLKAEAQLRLRELNAASNDVSRTTRRLRAAQGDERVRLLAELGEHKKRYSRARKMVHAVDDNIVALTATARARIEELAQAPLQ